MDKSKKSHIPISNTHCRRHIEAAAAAAVPLSKFDDKKNKRSRMAQDKGTNKNKNPFSSSSFSSFTSSIMNHKKNSSSAPSSLPRRKVTANNNTGAVTITTKKFSLSPPATLQLRSRIPAANKAATTTTTPATTTVKSRVTNKTAQLPPATATSRRISRPTTPATATAAAATTKRISRPTTPKAPTPRLTLIRKSPLTQLKEDLEDLRKKKQDNECLIKKQGEEIINLKKRLELENALKIQLAEKSRLENKLDSVTEETKNLSIEVVDLLQVNKKDDSAIDYQEEINKLQTQLETQEREYKKQLDQKLQQLNDLDAKLQTHKNTVDQLKLDHAVQIAPLNSNHTSRIHKLKAGYEQDLNQLKDQFKSSNATSNKISNKESLAVDDLIEQALLEFEQEQYNHPTAPIMKQQENTTAGTSLIKDRIHLMNKNQQWYTKNYMPVDALSWPVPQPMTHLRKLQC